jgi:hypothetical protein
MAWTMQLSHNAECYQTFASSPKRKKKGIHALADFSAYMFEYEDKETFQREFAILRTKGRKANLVR